MKTLELYINELCCNDFDEDAVKSVLGKMMAYSLMVVWEDRPPEANFEPGPAVYEGLCEAEESWFEICQVFPTKLSANEFDNVFRHLFTERSYREWQEFKRHREKQRPPN